MFILIVDVCGLATGFEVLSKCPQVTVPLELDLFAVPSYGVSVSTGLWTKANDWRSVSGLLMIIKIDKLISNPPRAAYQL